MDLITFNSKYNKNNDESFFNDLYLMMKECRIKELNNILKHQSMYNEKEDCVRVKFILNKIKELEKELK